MGASLSGVFGECSLPKSASNDGDVIALCG